MGMRPPLGLVKYAEFTKEPAVLKWWFAHCSRQEVEAIQSALRFMLGVREGLPGLLSTTSSFFVGQNGITRD